MDTKPVPLTEEQIVLVQQVLNQVYRTRLFPDLLPAQFKYMTEIKEVYDLLEAHREKKQTVRLTEDI